MPDSITTFLDSLGSPGVDATSDVRGLVVSLLLAFLLGQCTAVVYRWTHVGVSYSRTFTQSLVVLTMAVTLVMHVIGDNIVTAFGLLGALAIIRFRNVLKDTRDTSFVFVSLVLGMALGAERHLVALVGGAALLLVILYMRIANFGATSRFDGHLSCRLPMGEALEEMRTTLRRFCRRTRQVSSRHVAGIELVEYVFEVRLRDRRRGEEMVEELRRFARARDASLVLRDELAEI
ncbi:MAG: DUF4956 domain-containing protein [Planctomycetota bacterium]